jgi:hypothetical protein
LALQLVPGTAAARARRHPLGFTRGVPLTAPSPGAGAFGLRPQDLHTSYDLPTSASSVQTVALVDAYNDPNAEADLKAEMGSKCSSTEPGCSPCTEQGSSAKCVDVMGYHDAREIPNYWTYAQDFVLQDDMFEPNSSWSWPEHLFAAQVRVSWRYFVFEGEEPDCEDDEAVTCAPVT